MQVVFRADASVILGAGHVMRCLALAQEIHACGGTVRFLCREEEGHLCDVIRRSGFVVDGLKAQVPLLWEDDLKECLGVLSGYSTPVDWLIVDHYALESAWEAGMRKMTQRIFVIDDLADRHHDCDMLLDQNLRTTNPYGSLMPVAAKLLLGPHYALLREEFWYFRQRVVVRAGQVRRLVVFFGASDPTGETVKALQALRLLDFGSLEVDVIVGANNPRKDEVSMLCAEMPYIRFHCQVTNMALFLAQADLALGAAGVSSWERLALGLPALVVAIANNQTENMNQLGRENVAIGLGRSSEVSMTDMAQAIARILSNPGMIYTMSKNALALVDGKGVQRVAQFLMQESA